MKRIAAGIAALASVGLAACVDAGTRPAATADVVDSADQVLAGFETSVTRDGLRRAGITADTARLYEVSQSLALRKPVLVFYDAQGAQRSRLTADSALMFWTSGLITAFGNVVLTAPDGRVLKSETLRIDDAAREITTDQPFTLTSGSDFVRGTSLKTDPEFRNVTASKPRGRSDKPMLLPGQ